MASIRWARGFLTGRFDNNTDFRQSRIRSIVPSLLPVKAWCNAMEDPTITDAIMDRLVHNAYKLELKGESTRRKRSMLDQKAETVTV